MVNKAAGTCGSSAKTSRPAPPSRPASSAATSASLVDQRAARDVDQAAARAERIEHRYVDDVPRRAVCERGQHEDIDLRRELPEVGDEAVGQRLRARSGVGDGTEGAEPVGYRRADAAQPDDAEAAAGQAPRERKGGGGPGAGADMRVGSRKPAEQCDHQSHRGVGDVVGQHARGGGDADAAPPGEVEVDLVVADAVDRDDAEVRQPLDERARRADMPAGRDRANGGAVGDLRVARREQAGHREVARQLGLKLGREGAELEQPGLVHHTTASRPPST